MTLLDDVKDLPTSKWGSTILDPRHCKAVKELAPRARQFVFDEEASRHIGRFIRDCPDILIDQMQFARQPYDVTYIEVDLAAVYAAMGRPTSSGGEPDWRVGFLSNGGTVSTLTNTRTHPVATLSPLCILDNEYSHHPVTSYIDDSMVLLGSTWHDVTEAQREAFSHRFNMGYRGEEQFRDKCYEIMIPAVMGEARVYLAALLMLFQKQHVVVKDHPFERKMARGKLRTFMAHSTVTINLAGVIEVCRSIQISDRASPRRHEVRTHYKHRYLTPGCEHVWTRVQNVDNEQWRCTCCSGLRYLCKDHIRGDSRNGFITKDYKVTA